MQRRSVVFPDPLGPMITTASPRRTSVQTFFRTWLLPNHFDTPRMSISTGAVEDSVSVDIACPPLEVSTAPREHETDDEIDERDTAKDLERRERALDDLAADKGDIRQSNDGDQRGALHQHDERVDVRRAG